MNEIKLREYAKLIVKIGANVQKGQVVRLQVGVDQVPLAKMVTEECYKAGASRVELFWSCGEINKLDYQYASAEVLGEVPVWEEERTKQMVEQLPLIRMSWLVFPRISSPPSARCVRKFSKNTAIRLTANTSGSSSLQLPRSGRKKSSRTRLRK